MKKIIYTIVILFLYVSQISSKTTEKIIEVDVCVYGGTSAGVIAAYSAKMMGKSVVLVEPGKYLGGMTTGGLGSTDIGNKYAVTGLARQFYRKVGRHYNEFEQWMFPPSVATKAIMQFVTEARLDVIYQHRIVSADVKMARIRSIELENSLSPSFSTNIIISAKQFIDCTYEGDLMARSGVSYTTGREDCSTYGETLNGVQMSYWHQFPDGIDPYRVEGDPTSGLCWGISNNSLKKTGSGDKCIQAYNFRLCLTDVKENRREFEKPANYDPSRYELLARAFRKMEPDINKYLLINWGEMPENKYDVNNRGPLSTDMIGMNYDYPDGDYKTRERIWKEHVDYIKGLMYFLSHDEKVPAALRQKVNEFGWAKDEFKDNGNFPTQLYVREARRMIGEYVMTQKNCIGEEVVSDGVGLAAYIMDSHNCQRVVVNGMVKNEGDVQSGGFSPYPISYRSITPKRTECTNLLVPVCVSSSHIAYGSIRMEPVFMVLAQSAAVASVLAINNNQYVQDVSVKTLNDILLKNPHLNGSTPEILMDDDDKDAIELNGNWKKEWGYYYKSSYTHVSDKQGSLTCNSQVVHSGKYKVLFYCSSNIDKNALPECMNMTIKNGKLKKNTQIMLQKHSGKWVDLGTFTFNKGKISLTIDGKTPGGNAFFDAAILLPVK